MQHPERYIRFKCKWKRNRFVFPDEIFYKLSKWRKILYDMNLVGAYPDGVGFGNLSMRCDHNNFIITGSATGRFKTLKKEDFSLVTGYNFENNEIFCTGLREASAESLSHAAVYEASPQSNAVIHIHNLQFWEKNKNILPTTDCAAEYGTPEMAIAIMDLFKTTRPGSTKLLIMGGHPEGLISFGDSMDEAGETILKCFSDPF